MFRIALPAVAASAAVLALGGVGAGVWMTQAAAIIVSMALAATGPRLLRRVPEDTLTLSLIVLAMAALAATESGSSAGPQRWLSAGRARVYVAPAVVPAFMWALAACVRAAGRGYVVASASALAVALLLARQPDASQALAFVAGVSPLLLRHRGQRWRSAFVLAVLVTVAAWTFRQPDPLSPVPYVEGVFALAWQRSMLIGGAVIAAAIALVAGLQLRALRGQRWASAAAGYYAVVFGCSVIGLTPAPLVGFGAGPWLGFGLLAAVAGRDGV